MNNPELLDYQKCIQELTQGNSRLLDVTAAMIGMMPGDTVPASELERLHAFISQAGLPEQFFIHRILTGIEDDNFHYGEFPQTAEELQRVAMRVKHPIPKNPF